MFHPATTPAPEINALPIASLTFVGETAAAPSPWAARDFNVVSPNYQPTGDPLGAEARCLLLPVRPQKTRLPAAAGEGELHSTTKWLGVPSADAKLLSVGELQYPCRHLGRWGVTMEAFVAPSQLLKDLECVLKFYKTCGVKEASSALIVLMAESGGSMYQLPFEILGNRKFAYSAAKVAYVDQVGSFLCHQGKFDLRRFVLFEVVVFYASRVALRKSSCSLMVLHSVEFAHQNWSAYRPEGETEGCVILSAVFVSDLSAGDFPSPPRDVWASSPSLQVHTLLPTILKNFTFPSADHLYLDQLKLSFIYVQEWPGSVSCAFMMDVYRNTRVILQPRLMVAVAECLAPTLPDAALHHSEHGSSNDP